MHSPSTLFSLALLLAPGCATPEPVSSPMHTAHETALSQRLRGLASRAPLIVAHRGASASHPENTLPAFSAGLDDGAAIVELDFRQARDGTLVCLHDQTIDRTTDGAARFGRDRVAVDTLSLAELDALDAGSWKGSAFAGVRVPTLRQALQTIQPRGITMIEHKSGDAAALVELLRDGGWTEDVIVQSFDWEWLSELRRLAPTLTLGALGSNRLTADDLARLDALGVSLVHWEAEDLTLEDLRALEARGFLTCVYTVDDDLGLLGAIGAGLSAITTDVPARLRKIIDDRG